MNENHYILYQDSPSKFTVTSTLKLAEIFMKFVKVGSPIRVDGKNTFGQKCIIYSVKMIA